MMGWDVLALGLPASGEDFESGHFVQRIELPGVWLERARLRGDDRQLLDSPLGLAGHRVMATMWFAAGSALAPQRRDTLIDGARELCTGHALAALAGCTSPSAPLVVLRVLAPRVEPAMQLLTQVWARWRRDAWSLDAPVPRVWRT